MQGLARFSTICLVFGYLIFAPDCPTRLVRVWGSSRAEPLFQSPASVPLGLACSPPDGREEGILPDPLQTGTRIGQLGFSSHV